MLAFTILGLPAHPLIVHGAVVGIPLAAGAMLAYVARPSWRPYLRIPALVTVVVAWTFSLLAGSTGETLEHALEHSTFIEEHAMWAGRLGVAMHVLAAAAVLLLVIDLWCRHAVQPLPSPMRLVRRVVPVVTVLAAAACLALVGVVGHLGAKAAWHDSPAASASMRAE